MGRRKKEETVEHTLELNAEVETEAVAEEVEAVEEELTAEAHSEEPKTVEVEAVEEETKPQRRRSPRKSKKELEQAMSPEHNIEWIQETALKSMQEMLKHWQSMQDISANITTQLDKVAHIVKPTIQDFVSTQDMQRPEAKTSQFVTRFAIAASVVAILLSFVSLSMSQSARQVALNAEVARVSTASQPALAFNPRPSETIKLEDPIFPVKNRTKNRR